MSIATAGNSSLIASAIKFTARIIGAAGLPSSNVAA